MADRLTMEINMAREAGMSYGMWKALQPAAVVVKPKEPEEELRMCQYCGNPIPHAIVLGGKIERYGQKKYCSDKCRQAAYNTRHGRPPKGKKKVTESKKPGKCRCCGKQIPEFDEKGRKKRYDAMYCSKFCLDKGRYAYNKAVQEQRIAELEDALQQAREQLERVSGGA